jgi:hypothetical protein
MTIKKDSVWVRNVDIKPWVDELIDKLQKNEQPLEISLPQYGLTARWVHGISTGRGPRSGSGNVPEFTSVSNFERVLAALGRPADLYEVTEYRYNFKKMNGKRVGYERIEYDYDH